MHTYSKIEIKKLARMRNRDFTLYIRACLSVFGKCSSALRKRKKNDEHLYEMGSNSRDTMNIYRAER